MITHLAVHYSVETSRSILIEHNHLKVATAAGIRVFVFPSGDMDIFA